MPAGTPWRLLTACGALHAIFCDALRIRAFFDRSRGRGREGQCGWQGMRNPPAPAAELGIKAKLPEVRMQIDKVCSVMQKMGKPEACTMFRSAFPNTLDTTAQMQGNETFIRTGDIEDMWLRDSSAQVNHYIRLLDQSGGPPELRRLLVGLFQKQMKLYMRDQYANAFSKDGSVAERKYELDSVCYVMNLGYGIWKQTQDPTVFGPRYLKFLRKVMAQCRLEQFHGKQSAYVDDPKQIDYGSTSPRGHSKVQPGIGLIWQGYRPSDDSCAYHYNIPGNMMAAVQLERAEEVLTKAFGNETLAGKARKLRAQIDLGIHKFGRGNHPVHGNIYAYEVDGLGGKKFMDDANIPSLLSIPYIGYSSPHHSTEELYSRTRLFVLSRSNPYFFVGKTARGVGSTHTSSKCIWHLGLIMEALTSHSLKDKMRLLDTIYHTTAGTGLVHESFHADDPSEYTRGWFGWGASLLSELMVQIADLQTTST